MMCNSDYALISATKTGACTVISLSKLAALHLLQSTVQATCNND